MNCSCITFKHTGLIGNSKRTDRVKGLVSFFDRIGWIIFADIKKYLTSFSNFRKQTCNLLSFFDVRKNYVCELGVQPKVSLPKEGALKI